MDIWKVVEGRCQGCLSLDIWQRFRLLLGYSPPVVLRRAGWLILYWLGWALWFEWCIKLTAVERT